MQYSSPSISVQPVYEYPSPPEKAFRSRKPVIFRGTPSRRSSVFEPCPVREISPTSLSCLRRSSSVAVSLTLLVAFFFLMKFPFLGVNYLNQLNVKEFLGTMLQ